jgi:hypothetical protein
LEVELKSNWQEVEVEILKSLHGYKFKDVNDEIGYVDYVTKGISDQKKLLRVIVGPKYRASRAYVKTVEDTLIQLEEKEYDKATLIAKSFSSASKKLVREANDLDMISLSRMPHSNTEIIGANQNQVRSLCESMCGGLPKSEEDCKGLVDGEYLCEVRRISDDSDFHAKMGWLQMLKSDFSRLIDLQKDA